MKNQGIYNKVEQGLRQNVVPFFILPFDYLYYAIKEFYLVLNSCYTILAADLQQKGGEPYGRYIYHISYLCHSKRSQLLHMQMAG